MCCSQFGFGKHTDGHTHQDLLCHTFSQFYLGKSFLFFCQKLWHCEFQCCGLCVAFRKAILNKALIKCMKSAMQPSITFSTTSYLFLAWREKCNVMNSFIHIIWQACSYLLLSLHKTEQKTSVDQTQDTTEVYNIGLPNLLPPTTVDAIS